MFSMLIKRKDNHAYIRENTVIININHLIEKN
jgi:hypothetical protein